MPEAPALETKLPAEVYKLFEVMLCTIILSVNYFRGEFLVVVHK
jgi:hypothetical protein